MLPTPENYAIYPAVVPSNKETDMAIIPTEKAFYFVEDSKYELTIIGQDNDEPNYKCLTSHEKITVEGHGGVLRFAYTFAGEQKYLILIKKEDETLLGTVALYALHEDLYDLTPLKTDLHSHSCRSDGARDPSAEAGHYREQGYDCFALTDHNRFYPGGEIDETFDGVETSFFRIPGEEVHAPGSIVHIVHIGGKSSVDEIYCKDEARFTRETDEYMTKVPSHVPEQYRERYAKSMWATDKIHEAGGIAIFPHPFWLPGSSKTHNVCVEFAKILLRSGMFDAYELIGGMKQLGNNLSVALWSEMREEGVKIPVVGSSDVHKFEKSVEFPHQFTICFAKTATPDGVKEAIKAGNTVAVEATGTEYERHHRCYGSLRLVMYAQFLLAHFYPKAQRIATSEGVAMRAYAIGEAEKELVEVQAKYAKDFRDRFFGKQPPIFPSKKHLAFEDKWRAIQLQGPRTKGSGIRPDPNKPVTII